MDAIGFPFGSLLVGCRLTGSILAFTFCVDGFFTVGVTGCGVRFVGVGLRTVVGGFLPTLRLYCARVSPILLACSAILFPVNGYDLIALLKNLPALIEVMIQLFNADEPNELI